MKDIKLRKITLLKGAEVTVDFSQRQTSCKKCKKLIRFGVTKNEKYIPISKKDGDWEQHFASCVSAKSFSKKDTKKEIDKRLDQMEKEREKLNKNNR